MADIPKNLPDEKAPSFLGYSHPIEQPKPDLQMETLFKGINSLMTDSVKGADTVIKDNIQSGLYDTIDKQRGDFSSELTQFNKDTKAPMVKTSEVNPMNTYAQASEDDMPDDVSGVGSQASSLVSARSAGKISPTQYWLAIDNIAKDYRSRYPGYRDYIDQQISGITGHNPANAYMTSIMSDLNRNIMAQGKQDPWAKKAIDTYTGMVKDGQIPAGQESEYASMAQNDPVKFLGFANTVNAPKWQYQASNLDLQIREGKFKDAQITARVVIPQWLDSHIWSGINGTLTVGGETIQSIQRKMKEFGDEPGKSDPAAVQQLAVKLTMLRQMSEQQVDTFLNTPVGPNGETRAQAAAGLDADPGQWIANLKKARYANIDTMLGNLTKNRPELGSMQAELIQAQATNDKYKALFNEDPFATHLRITRLLGELGTPKDVQDYMRSMLEKGQYGNANINVWAKNTFGEFSTGKTNGKIVSVDEAIKKARTMGITDPKLFNDFASYGQKILDPNLSEAHKVNLAASMFAPQNLGVLDNFKEDQIITDASGAQRHVQGKYAVWQMYANPAMASEIERLGKNNPQVKTWYKSWIEQAGGSDIFGQQIRDLSTTVADPRLKISYNNVTNRFNPPETPGQSFQDRYAASVQRGAGRLGTLDDQIYKVNQYLDGLKASAQVQGITEPAAVQGYILGQLKGLGFVEPTPKVRPDPKTLGDQITNAFIAAGRALNPLAGGTRNRPSEPQRSPPMRLNSSEVPSPTPENTLDQNTIYHYSDPQYGPISGTIKQLFEKFK